MSAVAISEPTTKAEYYSILTTKERELSESLGKTFFDSSRKSVEAIKEAGDALITAKKKLKGKFMYFCKYELPVDCSQDTIEGFMRVATFIDERPQLVKYNPTILIELSKKSTPPAIVEELTTLAETNQHQGVKVKDVKGKIAEAKKNIVNIKKGDIVEWQMRGKHDYTFGRVRSKSSDGITCRIESLDGRNLGEKATSQLSLCPVQKVHEGIIDTQALQIKLGQKVVISPYSTECQTFAGKTGVVMVRYPQRRTFTVDMGDLVRDFYWEELRLFKEEPTPPPTTEETELDDDDNDSDGIIDVKAEVIPENPLLPESPPTIDLKKLGWNEKRELLKELLKEMREEIYLPNQIELELEKLAEKSLKELDENFGNLDGSGVSQRTREQFVMVFIDKCL